MSPGRLARRELFVYWRVADGDVAAALAAAAAMQDGLRTRHPGLRARLYRREPGAEGGSEPTVMETYGMARADLGALVQADIEHAARALAGWCRGVRHFELFECVEEEGRPHYSG